MINFQDTFSNLKAILKNNQINDTIIYGKVSAISESLIESKGIEKYVFIGQYANLILKSGKKIACEVINIKDDIVKFLLFEDSIGAQIGDKIELSETENCVYPDLSWRGRIIDAFTKPKDDLGTINQGSQKYYLQNNAPDFDQRKMVGEKVSLGTRAIDIFTPCCLGQRIGIFGGSGLGKSILISRLVKYAKADIKIIGFIGERSREIKEFIEQNISPDEMKNVVLITSSAEQSPLIKKRTAYLTMTVAEYFRDQGFEVICMMDSITRFAMAQREISLTAGQIPINRGYTASVFNILPKLLERSGPGKSNTGNITGLFSVLVEGEDTSEPISDCIKSILDGHVVLDKELAERNIFPAINIFKSVSRTSIKCYSDREKAIVKTAKHIIKTYEEIRDMINLGIYKQGNNQEIDNAIFLYPKIMEFLNQDISEHTDQKDSFDILEKILNMKK